MRISDWSSDVCSSDYLAKPWDDQKLMATVNNLLELGQAQRELSRKHAGERQRRTALLRENDLRGLVFDDPASEATVALACPVARSYIPLLVPGPHRTGKEPQHGRGSWRASGG